MPTTIKVSIAKLGTSIQEVEVNVGATVMIALKKAGYNLDGVVSVKRNGAVAALDAEVFSDDVLLVSMDKIKGGADEVEPSLLRVSFTIEKENQVTPNGALAFTDDMSTFDIVRQVMHSRGVSLNYFKELKDSEGTTITFADQLIDGASYKIIISDDNSDESDDDNDDE